MKAKKNNWKTATILLGLLVISLLTINIIQSVQPYKIEGKNGLTFEISKANFERAVENMDYLQSKKLIDIEHMSLIKVIKIGE